MIATKTAKRIMGVKVERIVDDCPDLSHLGEYTSRPAEDAVTIDRQERGDMGRHEFRYFIASMSAEDTGNPKSVEQDYERCEAYNRGEWCMMGVQAVATIEVNGIRQTIRSGGLWGIESDSGSDYFGEVGEQELDDLRGMLAELGFSAEEIGEACDEVDTAGDD
jgi:hypothetical protein